MSGVLWQFAGVLAEVSPSPSPTPGLREGLDEGAISPGLAGFLAVFAIALASLALFYSLTGKLRGVKRRGELAEAERAVSDGGTRVGDETVPGDDAVSDGDTARRDGEPGDPGRA